MRNHSKRLRKKRIADVREEGRCAAVAGFSRQTCPYGNDMDRFQWLGAFDAVIAEKARRTVNEKITFRYIVMPCCNTQLCWVNPRLPSFCPECGQKSYAALKNDGSHIRITDEDALLRYHT